MLCFCRPSRIPGCGIPKSSIQTKPSNHSSKHSTKSKSNHIIENNLATENYRLTFVKNTSRQINHASKSAISVDCDVVTSLSDSDESCEILSLSSAEPSPAKDLDSVNQFQGMFLNHICAVLKQGLDYRIFSTSASSLVIPEIVVGLLPICH